MWWLLLLRRRASLTLQWSDTVQCCTGRCWRKKLIQKIFQSSLKQLWVLSYLYIRCNKSKYCYLTLRVQFDQLCQKISEVLVKIWTEPFSPSGNLPKKVAQPQRCFTLIGRSPKIPVSSYILLRSNTEEFRLKRNQNAWTRMETFVSNKHNRSIIYWSVSSSDLWPVGLAKWKASCICCIVMLGVRFKYYAPCPNLLGQQAQAKKRGHWLPWTSSTGHGGRNWKTKRIINQHKIISNAMNSALMSGRPF